MKGSISVLGLTLLALFHMGCGSTPAPTTPAATSPTVNHNYPYSFTFGNSGTGPGQFNNPQGIAVYRGSIFVADVFNNRVEKFDSNGYYLSSVTLAHPIGIVFDSFGFMYVALENANQIQKVDQNFNILTSFGSAGTAVGQFNTPQGISIDSQDRIYIADYLNNRIQRCSNTGMGCVTIGGTAIGTGNGQFSGPFGVFVDKSGNVWVPDSGNNRIQEFDSTLAFLQKWGTSGAGNGQLNVPNDVRVDLDGNVIVADTNNHRIEKFTTDGTFIQNIGTGFSGPNYLAIDANNNLYVTDYLNFNVTIFTPN
jgi:tripartite motif-containing protein 71